MAIFNSYVSLPEGIFSLINLNHPAIGVPPFMETPTWNQLNMGQTIGHAQIWHDGDMWSTEKKTTVAYLSSELTQAGVACQVGQW